MKLENVLLIVGAGCLIAGITTINIAPDSYWLQKTFINIAIPSVLGAWITREYSSKINKFLGIKNKDEDKET